MCEARATNRPGYRKMLQNVSLAFLTDEPLLYYRWHGGNTILENACNAGREEFDAICQYLPLLVAEGPRLSVEVALRHLAGLALICPSTQSIQVLRLEAEAARLQNEVARLRAERERVQADFARFRASYSFRLGAILLYPMRRLRDLLADRR